MYAYKKDIFDVIDLHWLETYYSEEYKPGKTNKTKSCLKNNDDDENFDITARHANLST